ncbi:UNVERIFIED_CONTAM: hypothetical protein Scaly_2186900 [Sesamum calycinum]|uniref:Uncharacterized protein n=1 Tax=Sesamum calycinum TaxID=2727403 RepID=A0AAW2MMZ6_9LAMI
MQGVPFTEAVMANELPANCHTPAITEYDGTTDLQERLSHFKNVALLHQYGWNHFHVFKDNEPLKEYLQRFNIAALEVFSATQEVKTNAFSQGLLDGDFFKSLAKKLVSKFDALLARATKYINMENDQVAKEESRGEKKKEVCWRNNPSTGYDSLLLKLGTQTPQKICMVKFLTVDVSSAYNAILGRHALKAFQAVISTCHMKIKFLAPGGMGEVQRDPLLSRKCYIEIVRKGQKRNMEETYKEAPSNKQRKGVQQEEKSEEGEGTSPKVLPAKKMLNIELSLGDSGKTTQIGSQMDDTIWKEVI